MEAVEGIVKIGDKEERKIVDLMKKEKRENGCWQRLRSICPIQKIFKCEKIKKHMPISLRIQKIDFIQSK